MARQLFAQNRALTSKSGLTSAAADSGYAASLRAWLARKGAGIQASLAKSAAAAKLCRWVAACKIKGVL